MSLLSQVVTAATGLSLLKPDRQETVMETETVMAMEVATVVETATEAVTILVFL